ncbi:ABC transporter ATP-binding protein [Bhargavaea cecembensis]|uniref:ABC transporter ATP-binding protein n=1 Tax=Bhargavaea cecembensis TaxID=394098 RepID=A0A165GNH4_9BACL|nr:ABC transporter ATP-binding protein [Bhargavaea cecembensis]KZE37079.1 ABC transporter ATP-binding protein [Bhargavaea cecembensis]
MIEVKGLSHSFRVGKKGKETEVPVLKELALKARDGEIVSIVGRSGSGKSTLLHILAGFLQPDAGRVLVDGTDLTAMGEAQRAAFRLDRFGFVFQNFQLMPGLTAFENIELPLTLKGVPASERKRKVEELMESVGLTGIRGHYPNELSGGQQQRVGIARALVTEPPVIFADEPTGSLDSETEQDILNLILSLNRKYGITFVIITHDDEVAAIANRQYRMHDGELAEGGIRHVV